MSCENTSCPFPVVPNQLTASGPRYGGKFVAVGECGAISGANIAMATIRPRMIRPVRALPLLHSVRSARPMKRNGPGIACRAMPEGTRAPLPGASGGGTALMIVMPGSGICAVVASSSAYSRVESDVEQVNDED